MEGGSSVRENIQHAPAPCFTQAFHYTDLRLTKTLPKTSRSQDIQTSAIVFPVPKPLVVSTVKVMRRGKWTGNISENETEGKEGKERDRELSVDLCQSSAHTRSN